MYKGTLKNLCPLIAGFTIIIKIMSKSSITNSSTSCGTDGLIKAAGCQPGLVFNPAMPLDVLDWVIEDIDLILLMSVNPGFGGQSFIDSTLRKVEAARKRIEACGKDIRLEVDGGIKASNIRAVADAGADTFVAGSAIFGKPDYQAEINAMRAALAR